MKVKQEDGTTLVVGGVPVVELTDGTFFSVPGCPVADGKGPCSTTCGGNVAGSRLSTESLTAAVLKGDINPTKLGCQPLVDNASEGILFLYEHASTPAAIPVEIPVEIAA